MSFRRDSPSFCLTFTVYRRRNRKTRLVCRLDTPKTVALFLSCFCLKFYRLPTTCCENDTIRHAFLSSFTVYRQKKQQQNKTKKKKTRRFQVCLGLNMIQKGNVILCKMFRWTHFRRTLMFTRDVTKACSFARSSLTVNYHLFNHGAVFYWSN